MLFWERCHLNMPTITEGSLVIASNSCGGVRAARLELPHIENIPIGIHVAQGATHRNCAKWSSTKTEEKRLWHSQGHKLCCSPYGIHATSPAPLLHQLWRPLLTYPELTSPVSGWCLYYMGLFQLFRPDLTKEGDHSFLFTSQGLAVCAWHVQGSSQILNFWA